MLFGIIINLGQQMNKICPNQQDYLIFCKCVVCFIFCFLGKNKSEVDEDQMEFVPERKNPSNVSDLLDQDVESIKNLEAVLHVEKVYKEHVRKRNVSELFC